MTESNSLNISEKNKKLKILFTIPLADSRFFYKSMAKGVGINNFSYGVASLSALAKSQGFSVEFFDSQLVKNPTKDFQEYLKSKQFDLIGMTVYSMTVHKVIETAEFCKKILPEVKIVLGGAHATVVPKETLELSSAIDFVVFGEGEYTFLELISALEDNKEDFSHIKGLAFRKKNIIILNQPRPIIKDLNELPMPDYRLFPIDKYVVSPNIVTRYPTFCLQVSRGCPYNCAFCEYNKALGKKFRTRSFDNIIKEIKYLKKGLKARGLVFRDSTFTLNKNWLEEFCRIFIKEKINIPWMCYSRTDAISNHPGLLELMKKAGCWQIGFGCESANQKSLDLLNKQTTVKQNIIAVKETLKIGINVSTTWIIALPGEGEEDVMNTINLACTLGGHIAKFFLPIPYPGTKLYEFCKDDGGINKDFSWEDYDMLFPDNPVYINPRIGKEKMKNLLKLAYRKFYTKLKVIFNVVKSLSSIDAVKKYYYAAMTLKGIPRIG